MKTMILDNNPQNVLIYDKAGVDRIFVDLEILGKEKRQGHLDTVISNHTVDDVSSIKKIIKHSQLLVRINPLNPRSENEINDVIDNGADIVMLPMFKTSNEVKHFLKIVNGRAKTSLLLETAQALVRIDEILNLKGIDEIHIGLNDLHLALGLDFMFELLSSDIVEYLAAKISKKGIPYGIGGIAKIGGGDLPANVILNEHVRLGSTAVILSRTFKGEGTLIEKDFVNEHRLLKEAYQNSLMLSSSELNNNRHFLKNGVKQILSKLN